MGGKMKEEYVDILTGIGNERYLEDQYYSYCSRWQHANLVMIDLRKFKGINDVFGHHEGDNCLCFLASILKKYFENSIVVRLHGDEFLIVTFMEEMEIEKQFHCCQQEIVDAANMGKIPLPFLFNAGVSKCFESLEKTKEIADFMMYSAKSNDRSFQRFSLSLLEEKERREAYLAKVDLHLREKNFSYWIRDFFDIQGNFAKIYQVRMKDKEGSEILNRGEYSFLRSTSRVFQLDRYNLENLLLISSSLPFPFMFTIDYRSLLLNHNLLSYLQVNACRDKTSFSPVILSIDVSGINSCELDLLRETIVVLNDLQFKVGLENYDSKIGDFLWENGGVDYLKFSNSYWKTLMNDDKRLKSFFRKSAFYHDEGITCVFDCVSCLAEYQMFFQACHSDFLLSGEYFSSEHRLCLKK